MCFVITRFKKKPSEAGNVMGQFASNVLPLPDGAIGVSKGGVPIPAGAIKTTIVRKVVKAGWLWGECGGDLLQHILVSKHLKDYTVTTVYGWYSYWMMAYMSAYVTMW